MNRSRRLKISSTLTSDVLPRRLFITDRPSETATLLKHMPNAVPTCAGDLVVWHELDLVYSKLHHFVPRHRSGQQDRLGPGRLFSSEGA